jgi:hypothetical protein
MELQQSFKNHSFLLMELQQAFENHCFQRCGDLFGGRKPGVLQGLDGARSPIGIFLQ